MTLQFRLANPGDAYALWIWANDPATRAASGDRPLIPWSTHVRWLRGRLGSPDALILIAEDEHCRPVGTVRFETDDRWLHARLSYGLAPEARGFGLGLPLLAGALGELDRRTVDTAVTALVRPGNPASQRLFEKLRWSAEPAEGGAQAFVRHPRVSACG